MIAEKIEKLQDHYTAIQKELVAVYELLDAFRGSVPVTITQEGLKGEGYIWELFTKAFPKAQIYPLDGIYKATNLATIMKINEEFAKIVLPYIADYRDCENFAIYYKGHLDMRYALNQDAINYSYVHGYNSAFFIPDFSIKLIEPQNGRIITIQEAVSRTPAMEMPEKVWIEKLRLEIRMDDAVRAGMYDTVFIQV